ncbi:hypothetical protein [Martelella alba]|nr:hypothetical protein [Martelella alba]
MTVSDAGEAAMIKMSKVGALMPDGWMKSATPEQAKFINDYNAMN